MKKATFSLTTTESMMFGGVGLNFGTIKTNLAKFHDSHFTGKYQDLHKKRLQLVEKAFAECGYGIMIRMGIDANKAKSNGIIGCLLNFSAGIHPGGIPIEQ